MYYKDFYFLAEGRGWIIQKYDTVALPELSTFTKPIKNWCKTNQQKNSEQEELSSLGRAHLHVTSGSWVVRLLLAGLEVLLHVDPVAWLLELWSARREKSVIWKWSCLYVWNLFYIFLWSNSQDSVFFSSIMLNCGNKKLTKIFLYGNRRKFKFLKNFVLYLSPPSNYLAEGRNCNREDPELLSCILCEGLWTTKGWQMSAQTPHVEQPDREHE